jgi:hypothetical protein
VKQKIVRFSIVESMAVHAIFIDNTVFDERIGVKIFQVPAIHA